MKTKKNTTKLLCLLLVFINLLLVPSIIYVEAEEKYSEEQLIEKIEGIINWKKESAGIASNDPLLNNQYLEHAGETVGDWFPIGIGRIGYQDDYNAYLAVINDVVSQRYMREDKLDGTKSTEWHRISLAILAMGGDPTSIGKDENGQPINLIADGTYNRGKTVSLGAQGINGWIWGLLALDSMRYKIPEDAFYSRDDIIKEILQLQLADGGFSFYHNKTDPDITGMALQALAPYYNSEQTYTFQQKATKKTVTKTVRQVVDESIQTLSELQLPEGDFASWETENAESTVQVLVALAALGKDPLNDERFIKNGNNLLDGIMKYKNDDGGFIHSKVYNPDNPTSLPDESNTMASEQVLYSLVALYRYKGDYRTLYDFREEMNEELKAQIASVKKSIDLLPVKVGSNDTKKVEAIFAEYKQIPISERSYVFNYYKLSDVMKTLGISNTSESISQGIGVTESGNGTITPLFDQNIDFASTTLFTAEDIEKVNQLPKEITTKYYVEVVKLIEKLEKAENRNDYQSVLVELQKKKTEIEKIKKEIESLNNEILDKLYPFANLSIKDKKNVDEIVARYEKLSKDDRKKILSYEDVEKSKTQIDNLIRARMIAIVIGVVVVIVMGSVIWRMKKRKQAKLRQQMMMDED